MHVITDPVESRYEANNTTVVLPFSERLLLAERIIYVTVGSLLAWFVFEVRVGYILMGLYRVAQKKKSHYQIINKSYT